MKQRDKEVHDVIKPNLNILFVGINPGIQTAITGFHFAHPSNRFWKTLYAAGFTPYVLAPYENRKLLDFNFGITNVINRPTKSEKELTQNEFEKGRIILLQKINSYQPQWVAFIGIGLYRKTFNKNNAQIGMAECIYNSQVWILPQPSGLNAHYPPEKLVVKFKEFFDVVNSNK